MNLPVSGESSVSLSHHPAGTILLQSSTLNGGQFLLQSPIQIVQAAALSQQQQQPSTSSSTNIVQAGMKRSYEYAEIVASTSSSVAGSSSSRNNASAASTPSSTSSSTSTAEFLHGAFMDNKRKKEEKGGKGLRHFSMKVCEKVRAKGHTTYNEVADELVSEFAQDQHNAAANGDQVYDQKNIRRRVYDALNVLMAMNIISKEKKEIKWIGLPTNSSEEYQRLEQEKRNRIDRIAQKTRELHDLILYQIAYKNLVHRNKKLEQRNGPPGQSSAIPLPFVIVNTGKKTVIDCSISSDKTEYLFQFDNVFEINEEKDVLNMMGMTLGLDKPGQCTRVSLERAKKLVPKALEPYVVDIFNGVGRGEEASSATANSGGSISGTTSASGMDLLHAAVTASGATDPSLQQYQLNHESTSEQVEEEFYEDNML